MDKETAYRKMLSFTNRGQVRNLGIYPVEIVQ